MEQKPNEKVAVHFWEVVPTTITNSFLMSPS